MVTAEFSRTALVDTESNSHSVAIVLVNGNEVDVHFWYEIIEQMGKEDAKILLCLEALWQEGFYQEAHDLIVDDATGEYKDNVDTRNWQQNWLDGHKIPPVIHVPKVDPLK